MAVCQRCAVPAAWKFSRGQIRLFASGASQTRASLAQATRTSTESSASLSAWWRRRQDSGGLSNEAAQKLSQEVTQYAAEQRPSVTHVVQKDEFLQRLREHLAETIDGAEVAPFGSVVNGFWTPNSDVDVCVRVPGATTRNAQIQVLRQISAELTKVESHHVEARFGAQVPILHWAPLRPGMVSCDISVNNVLAVVNSRLVGRYVRLDDRLRTLGLCVKAWAAARGINDRSRGTLSSFSLVLMLIHFLQRREPPILPSLQDLAFSHNEKPRYINGVDCRFCTDAAQIEREMAYLRGPRSPNKEDVGTLLLDFFRHFGHEYRSGIIRIRDTRSVLPPGDESKCFLVVDNPFEVGKDVANVDASQQGSIRKEFRRAWSYLSQGRSFMALLSSPDAALR